ncbi:MAG TPA: dihydrodipicolinate synthase family protein [Acidimicrobiales bacterium]|nr:dihydrodipicolinate synthase family protein [Acidimicrobiales bacterium]
MTAGAIGVMSITPFDSEGSVDLALLRRHLERLAAHPVSIYVCSQGSGEGLGLSLAEKEAIYRTAVDVAGRRREVVGAGIGITGDTATAVEQVEVLSATGVAAVQVFPPRTGALRPKDGEIEGYYHEVVAASSCPLVLGENVTLVGYEMGPALIERLLRSHPEITGLSYTAPGSVGQLSEFVRRNRDRVAIRTGWLHHLANMAAAGAAGLLCFEGNVVPGLPAAVWRSLIEGRSDALDLLGRLLQVTAVLSRYGNPGSIKAVLDHLGLPSGCLRPPLRMPADPDRAALESAWDEMTSGRPLDTWL